MRSWTASSTKLTGSNRAANHSAERRLRRTPWLDPAIIQMERSASQRALPLPADIDRNGGPTSIGMGGRHQAGITGRGPQASSSQAEAI